jgi:DNA-binding transcriptional MerR regulator
MALEMTDFIDTTGTLAHRTGYSQSTIVGYCKEGLLDFSTLPNGMRLLRSGQEQRVHEL